MHYNDIIFIDIETVALKPEFDHLTEERKSFWKNKCKISYSHLQNQTIQDIYKLKAGIHAEYSKVIVVGLGYFELIDDRIHIYTKSISNKDEMDLLKEVKSFIVDNFEKGLYKNLSGHNIKEFDIPFLCRRFLTNNIALPHVLNLYGAKPWQTPHLIDTLSLWNFGDYKRPISLNQLCDVLSIDSPKSNIAGSDIHKLYWKDKDLKRIAEYCEKDVRATIEAFIKLKHPNMTAAIEWESKSFSNTLN